jgi:hypothetical protein
MRTLPDRAANGSPLTGWEKRIIGAFIERYPASAAAALDRRIAAPNPAAIAAPDLAAGTTGDDPSGGTVTVWKDAAPPPGGGEGPDDAVPPVKTPRPQRLPPQRIFPGLDRASPDDKESFLEAAESLERRGLLSLIWARHRKGETLSALICRDAELLYELAGKPSPKITAEAVRKSARLFTRTAEGYCGDKTGVPGEGGAPGIALFSFIAEHCTPQDAAGGIDVPALTDLAHLTQVLFAEKIRGLTTRALSTALYGDSKRLEVLMTLFNPLLTRARRRGIAIPDFSFLERAYPETFIAGKIALDFPDTSDPGGSTPLINAGGNILGFPLDTILKLRRIRPLSDATVLMIENKETFFALSQSLPGYGCFLYTGGHPNRAVRSLVTLLAESGFVFSHAGDLDPEGILILQELAEIAGKAVQALGMDAPTFDKYLSCGRTLEPSMLKRTALISEKTRTIPGMAELIRRIEETGMGVEQEIIDYRILLSPAEDR